MLFKEKLLLSNCDSVKRLPAEQLKKRFLTGMAFGDGVVLSPNMLIDNTGFEALLARRNVVKYLNEEGHGKLVLRGFGLGGDFSLSDYYHALPPGFIFSSLEGGPTKAALSRAQETDLLARVAATQTALDRLGYAVEPVHLEPDSLAGEIRRRLADDDSIGHFFAHADERAAFLAAAAGRVSRSDWYVFADGYFADRDEQGGARFKAEVIDPAYNSLFALQGEGFLQDNIKYIGAVPAMILDAGVAYKSLREEVALIEYSLKLFEIVSTLGTTELYKWLTDQALDYLEDTMTERGQDYITRRNWFGLYRKMRTAIGLEIK